MVFAILTFTTIYCTVLGYIVAAMVIRILYAYAEHLQ